MGKKVYSEIDEKNSFYDLIVSDGFGSDEVRALIESDGDKSGFYEVCSLFAEIGLNTMARGNSTGVFENSEADVSKAIKTAADYYAEHNFSDQSGFIELIQRYYRLTRDSNDPRVDMKFVPNPEFNGTMGVMGGLIMTSTFVDAKWDEIEERLKKALEK